ncbi:ABC transporter ATP-binding protein [Metabacillus halosaccharovorans]|uniref:ABC transporter ATP-binding protein n=1 Tax=Metabacillus halosaccharovorans TaxID=930124 RepID=UPI001C1FB79C|nr:ABC transporter ATP-binding protein [Metabacillus halosaccharovorans]MBU7591125.1 ABC transporter ATP-binding protein [Metabacillus halosaccharovorans]
MLNIFKYLKPYKWLVLVVICLTLTSTLFELYIPTLMANIIDIGIVNSDIPYILKTGIGMLILSLLAIVVTMTSVYFSNRVATAFGRDIRRYLFIKVESFSVESLEKFGTASLITRTTNDIKQVQDVLGMILGMATRAPLMLIGGIILAVSRDSKLSLIFFVSLPLLVLLIGVIMKIAGPLFTTLQKRTDQLNLIIRESLIGTKVTRAFNQVSFEKKRFNIANENFCDTGIKVNQTMALQIPIMQLIMNFTSVAIVWFGALRIDQGMTQVGNMMAFLQYALMIFMALVLLSIALISIPRAQASAKRISEVLQVDDTIKDPKDKSDKECQKGLLQFENVTYRYQGAEKAAIENISFTVNPGQTTAIIGSTGSGKSTIIQLIPRFFDPDEGRILVGGIDIRDMAQEKLREKIGYVPQKASLISGTIEENMRIGKKDATEEEIEEALTISQAIDFVKEKDNGIYTQINHSGSNLSGGQRQRLAIARALVRMPEVYLFDDSFSALDYKTDAKLRRTLKESLDATMVIVGQRVSSVKDADQIIVLDEGKVVGIGTHDYLEKTNSVYQEIIESQNTEGEAL